MSENIKLLMEETGCDMGEAELALELADNDLKRAIRTIESILRHIVALKGKFYFPQKNYYGLFIIILNTKPRKIIRFCTVVSYNPTLYENSPSMDWYAFEKLIFSYRLDEGSLPDYTREVEQKFAPYISENTKTLIKADEGIIARLIEEFFLPEKVVLSLEKEELNLAQFRKLSLSESSVASEETYSDIEPGVVYLEIDLIEDPEGKEASRLIEGETVLSKIADVRDIAHYLTHLIGSQKSCDVIPLPAEIIKVKPDADEIEVQVSYAPRIIGVVKLKGKTRVKVMEEKAVPWWKKALFWN